MTFPDGRIKDGMFENNIFKGAIKVREGSQIERKLNPAEEYKSIEPDVIINQRGEQNRISTNLSERAPREMMIKTRGAGSSSIGRQSIR